MRQFRLLFVDLDGTLVGKDDVVSPRTIAALNAAQAAGCAPVICTGRNHFMVRHVAAQWSGHGYAILSNGAIIAEWESGRVLHRTALAPTTVRYAARLAHDHGTSALLFGVHAEDGGERLYTDGRFPQPDAYLRRNASRLTRWDETIEDADIRPVGMGTYGPRELIERLANH
jgi:hydroxymethylpyrimidine pyrophosphatase-like HAD family hydrolase